MGLKKTFPLISTSY